MCVCVCVCGGSGGGVGLPIVSRSWAQHLRVRSDRRRYAFWIGLVCAHGTASIAREWTAAIVTPGFKLDVDVFKRNVCYAAALQS